MAPAGYKTVIHVSLTDDHPYARAFVVIEAIPETHEPHPAPSPPSEPTA